MTWSELIPLIVKYGIEGAYKLWQVFEEHGVPTKESWDKILALGLKPYDLYIDEARQRAGLPPLTVPPS